MVRHVGFEEEAQRLPKSLKTAHSPMSRALIWCGGPAPGSPQITILSWNGSPNWQGHLLLRVPSAAFCLVDIPRGTAPTVDVCVFPLFPVHTSFSVETVNSSGSNTVPIFLL